MKVLAIDPASKSLGVALFQDDMFLDARTFKTNASKDRLDRMADLIMQLATYMEMHRPDTLLIEHTVAKGHAHSVLERVRGAIEAVFEMCACWMKDTTMAGKVHYINAKTVKKLLVAGDAEKIDVAFACAKHLSEPAQDRLAELIRNSEFDATDAIAVYIAWTMTQTQEK